MGRPANCKLAFVCGWVHGQQEKRDAPSGGINGAVSTAKANTERDWSPCLRSVEGETIYDFAWQVLKYLDDFPFILEYEPRSRRSVVCNFVHIPQAKLLPHRIRTPMS